MTEQQIDLAALIAEARELLPLDAIEYDQTEDMVAHLADALEKAAVDNARLQLLADGRSALGMMGIFAADAMGDEAIEAAKNDYIAKIEAPLLEKLAASEAARVAAEPW